MMKLVEWFNRLQKRLALYNGRETYAFGMIMVGLSLTVFPNHAFGGGSVAYAETFWHMDRIVFAIISFVSAAIILILRPVGLLYIALTVPLMLFIFTVLKFSLDSGSTLVVFSLLLSYLWRILQDTTKP